MTKTQSMGSPAEPLAYSRDGYPFDPQSSRWKLSKEISVIATLPETVDTSTAIGFRSTLRRYAEDNSPDTARNVSKVFRRFLRETGATSVTSTSLINWRGMLGEQRQWPMGALRGFLLAWYDYGYSGVTEDIVQLLKGWRLKGNAVGEAVANGSPDDGPYTDLELAAILDSATMAVADHKLRFTDFAYLLSLAMLARRAMQIAALKGKDLLRTSENGVVEHRINIPRVKQRGKGFRESFRSLAIIEDLYLGYSGVFGRLFRLIPAACSGVIRPPFPGDRGHPPPWGSGGLVNLR